MNLVLVALTLLVVPGVHAASTNVNILVPAYFDPTTSASAWSALNSAATKLPNRVVAIANPASGPGTVAQTSYTNAITSLQSNQGRVVGYVDTSYATRSLAIVKADIDSWFSFFPSINGIFFDQVSNTNDNTKIVYYQTLYNYVKSKRTSSLLVVHNPGTATLESYLVYNSARVSDIICTFESGINGLEWTQASWTSKYDRSNFYGLFYNVSDINVASFDYGDIIDHAYQQNAGWVYVTNDNLPNPWDTIASYFSGEVSYIQQQNYLP